MLLQQLDQDLGCDLSLFTICLSFADGSESVAAAIAGSKATFGRLVGDFECSLVIN